MSTSSITNIDYCRYKLSGRFPRMPLWSQPAVFSHLALIEKYETSNNLFGKCDTDFLPSLFNKVRLNSLWNDIKRFLLYAARSVVFVQFWTVKRMLKPFQEGTACLWLWSLKLHVLYAYILLFICGLYLLFINSFLIES